MNSSNTLGLTTNHDKNIITTNLNDRDTITENSTENGLNAFSADPPNLSSNLGSCANKPS